MICSGGTLHESGNYGNRQGYGGYFGKGFGGCAKENVNVTEVTQSILQDLFAMIMLVDLEKATVPFNELVDQMTALGEQEGLKIHVMHEDIFNSMHRI